MAYTSKDRGFYKTMLGTSVYSGNTKTAQSGIGRKVISASKKKKSSFEDDFNERTIQKLKEEATPIKLPEIFSEGDSPKKAITVTSGKTQRNVFPDTNNSDVQESAVKEQISQGLKIRQTITDLLKNKYGEPDTKHLFDNIDDKDIEKNIPVAKNTIKTNVDMGKLEKDYPLKLPNLEDGLALSYAAADKGMNKAATRAREAAYMDGVSNTVRAVEDLLKKQTLESNVKVSNLLNKTDDSKTVSIENLAREGEAKGLRFKAEVSKKVVPNTSNNNSTKNNNPYAEMLKFDSSNPFTRTATAEMMRRNGVSAPRQEFGLVQESPYTIIMKNGQKVTPSNNVKSKLETFFNDKNYKGGKETLEVVLDDDMLKALHEYLSEGIKNASKPDNIGKGVWKTQVEYDLKWIDEALGASSKLSKFLKTVPYISIALDVGESIVNNGKIDLSDVTVDVGFGLLEMVATGAVVGSVVPVAGTVAGALAGAAAGLLFGFVTNFDIYEDKSIKELLSDAVDWVTDGIKSWFD